MQIRRATAQDLSGVDELLSQVLGVHAEGRPDLFRAETRKYTDEELLALFADDARPVFVAVEQCGEGGAAQVAGDTAPGDSASACADAEKVLGHAFCVLQDFSGSNNLQPIKSLYIDDICVDVAARGKGVATALYQHVVAYAREQGCHNLTLNVWECNPGARAFYDAMGLIPQKTCLEQVLD